MAAMTLEAMEKEIEALRSQVESLGGTPVNLNKAAVVRKNGLAFIAAIGCTLPLPRRSSEANVACDLPMSGPHAVFGLWCAAQLAAAQARMRKQALRHAPDSHTSFVI